MSMYRMHILKKCMTRRLTHTERYRRAACRAERFSSGNVFPVRNRVSCPSKPRLYSPSAELFFTKCVPYNIP